jgi:predicted dehydrogenase
MKQPYRAAVIGCGGISRPHAQAYLDSPEVTLVAAADLRQDACEGFGAQFGVEKLYDDAATMIGEEHPDIVSVCTPPAAHAVVAEIACRGGARAVISEKPMAMNLAEADRMLAAAQAAGTMLLVNHQRRYADRFLEARRLIEIGAIGEITQITGMCCFDVLASGTHLVDIVRFLVGGKPVHSVFGAVDMSPYGFFVPEFVERGTFEGHPIETSAMAILVFEDGMRAHLEIGELARPGYCRLLIDGTDGRMEVGGEGWEGGVDSIAALRYRTGDGPWVDVSVMDDFQACFTRSVGRLVEVLDSGGEHPLNADSARADLEILMAIYESARRRQLVRLPLAVTDGPLEAMLAAGEISTNRPEAMNRFARLADSDRDAEEVGDVAAALLAECPGLPGSQLGGMFAAWIEQNMLPPAQAECLRRVLAQWGQRSTSVL